MPKCRLTASIVCCSRKRTARCSGSGVRLPTNQWEEQVVEACAETISKRTVAARTESIVAWLLRWLLARCRQLCSTGGHSWHSCVVRVCARAPTPLVRSPESCHLSLCNVCGIFFFIPSVLLVSYIVIVHQRSFYSGAEDDAVLVVPVQPGYIKAKQVRICQQLDADLGYFCAISSWF